MGVHAFKHSSHSSWNQHVIKLDIGMSYMQVRGLDCSYPGINCSVRCSHTIARGSKCEQTRSPFDMEVWETLKPEHLLVRQAPWHDSHACEASMCPSSGQLTLMRSLSL